MASLHLAKEIFNLIYPVGSVYISVNSTNPTNLFGGTWVAIAQGRTLFGVNSSDGDFNTVMKTGGNKTHTLTVNEMPAHSHDQYVTANSGNAGVRKDYNQDASTERYYQCQTGVTGGGKSHSILNPYYTVYIFRRTA